MVHVVHFVKGLSCKCCVKGKTDVAVQIISNLYHNFPWQRTLVVTHSNQALNQLFEKVAELDVDERHLLRLGHGEEALQTDKDFSR